MTVYGGLRGTLIVMLLSAVVIEFSTASQSSPPRPAVPLDPVTAIIDAFQTHSLA